MHATAAEQRCRLAGLTASVALAALLAPWGARAAVIETKSLARAGEAVVVKGSSASGYYNLLVNASDATLSPNQIFVWAYDSGTGWRQVVFQIDEINNANPNAPPPTCDAGYNIGLGPNHMQADDGLWDSNDEIVFMCEESGDRVSQDEWAPGAVTTAPRYEIALTDPMDSTKKGWVYLFRHDALPTWRTDDYVAWNETTNTVTAASYSVDYPDSHQSALYFSNLSVSAAGGGTGANMVQKSRWYWYGGFALSCGSAETAIRTEQTITGGSCGTMVLPWYAKDGRVRVLRYFIWSPYCTWVTAGIGMWPCVHHYYYKSYWQEDHNDKYHGGSGHTDYWWSTVNHANTTTMTFYDSNLDTCTIDGTAETFANTPLWTWYQVSSAYGSYIKILRDTAKAVSPDSRRNLYTDSGTGQRGDAGYRIENPSETTEDAWDHFYYFLLPANAPNQGATYNTKVDSPLGSASSSQAYATPPEFTGIQSAVDYNGACVDQGVQVSWNAITNWNDGCSASCTNRKYQVYRSGTLVQTVTNPAATSWVDTAGTNNTSYNYGVEACGQAGTCTALGNTLPAMDYLATAPQLGDTATTAADLDGCTASGVQVTWAAPADWKDGGQGSRRYDLYWDGDGYAAPIATNVTSPSIYAAPAGVARAYRIQAVNGCSLTTNYAASSAVTDAAASAPAPPPDPAAYAADNDACSRSGITVQWAPVAVWGDGGAGSRKYDLYSSSNGFAAPIVPNATSPALVLPADSALYTYRVVATNGCGLTFAYTDAQVADGQVAPNFAGIQAAVDGSPCSASALTISWNDVNGDGPEGWNDGGAGSFARLYRIYRNGAEIANSPRADGVTSTTDQPPVPNTGYTYAVRAYNLNNCYTDGGASLPATDSVGVAPSASPGQTDAADITCEAGTGVTVTWDAVADWGDHGYNSAARMYRVYYSGNSYSSPISPAIAEGTTSFTYNAPDNMAFKYRVTARNGCALSKVYIASAMATDKSTCEPPCTLVVDNDFSSASTPFNSFGESCDGGKNYWTLQPGVGSGGTQAWRLDLPSNNGDRNQSAALELTAAVSVLWTTDVKLRFWSSCDLQSDDAGLVEVWTNDSATWRKVNTLLYPNLGAAVPGSMTLNCASDVVAGVQAAFQGTYAGAYYEARLDSYLTPATTQVNLRFMGAAGATRNASWWVVDDVKLGYGITDPVFYWSVNGDLAPGVEKSGDEALFHWEDGGVYQVTEWRLYRSANPSAIRSDATTSLIHTQADTDAAAYSWTTAEGAPPQGSCWFYRIYGFKQPCGESNQNEN